MYIHAYMYTYVNIYIFMYTCIHAYISLRICINTYTYSDVVLSKTAIFPKKERRKREISNESARGSSLREANV